MTLQKPRSKAKWTQLEALIGMQGPNLDILRRFSEPFVEQRQEVFEGKGMIVTMSGGLQLICLTRY
jgi:type I restriction enzyme R subunit